MKRIFTMAFLMILISAMLLFARGMRGDGQGGGGQQAPQPQQPQPQQQPQQQYSRGGWQAEQSNNPVVINLSNGESGGRGGNYPAQQRPDNSRQQRQQSYQPDYGRLVMSPNRKIYNRQAVRRQMPIQEKTGGAVSRQSVTRQSSNPSVLTAAASHHHPYTLNYIRKRLRKIGVKSSPGYITNRRQMIHTDRQHSIIKYPRQGINGQAIHAAGISSRNFNNKFVRSQMTRVTTAAWQKNVRGINSSEREVNHYYWHNEGGFDYCHYRDSWGYNWYGWYAGSEYFWVRNYDNRWWWYDADFDRWCFWNDGFWWWQDPYHIGDLYCYNDNSYVPVNSTNDSVAVAVPDNGNVHSYTSPDNTRVVKVVADTQDAFLYDVSNQPKFSPVYLASGVQDVMFSDTTSGKPLEIILKLNDGTFNMFDGNGEPYNTGAPSADGTTQDQPQ